MLGPYNVKVICAIKIVLNVLKCRENHAWSVNQDTVSLFEYKCGLSSVAELH